MNRRQFAQTGMLGMGLGAGRAPLAAAAPLKATDEHPGEWRTVPAARSVFDFHKVAARPSDSPGLACWCFMDRNPETGEVVLSFTEITDPTGNFKSDPPCYDFGRVQRKQVFLISRDRGETWSRLAEHVWRNAADAWQLNGYWEKMKFLPGGKLVMFASEHTHMGRRPMLFYSISTDMARTWSAPRAVTEDPKRSMFAGDLTQMQDGRWIHVYELYDLAGATSRTRVRRRPTIWMDRPGSPQRFGCAISTDGGVTWRDRPDLDITFEGELNRGLVYEPAITMLQNGNLLVVGRRHRREAFSGEGLSWRQWILQPAGDGFRVLQDQECQADVPLGHTGHPEILTTRDGIVVGVRSDGVWASIDDARFWEKIEDHYIGYYPQAVELDDGSILTVGHRGGDDPWPPHVDQDVRVTRLRITRTPTLRNLDRSVPQAFTLMGPRHTSARVRARIGTDGTAGVLARARVEDGKVSGYVLFATAHQPGWALGKLLGSKLTIAASGKLNGMTLNAVRPRLELAVVGDVVRAFVDTYPVASGRDRTFTEGAAGVIAEGGRARVEGFEVLAPASLEDIGGEKVELVRDLGAIGYEQAADNWQAF
jgi:hypothetical protein